MARGSVERRLRPPATGPATRFRPEAPPPKSTVSALELRQWSDTRAPSESRHSSLRQAATPARQPRLAGSNASPNAAPQCLAHSRQPCGPNGCLDASHVLANAPEWLPNGTETDPGPIGRRTLDRQGDRMVLTWTWPLHWPRQDPRAALERALADHLRSAGHDGIGNHPGPARSPYGPVNSRRLGLQGSAGSSTAPATKRA